MLLVQLTLTMLASQARADFITLTIVCITFYMLENTENLRRSTFRNLVGLIMVSLVYDIFWFNINGNADDGDGGMEASIRKFSLLMSYISFFFRVSLPR